MEIIQVFEIMWMIKMVKWYKCLHEMFYIIQMVEMFKIIGIVKCLKWQNGRKDWNDGNG